MTIPCSCSLPLSHSLLGWGGDREQRHSSERWGNAGGPRLDVIVWRQWWRHAARTRRCAGLRWLRKPAQPSCSAGCGLLWARTAGACTALVPSRERVRAPQQPRLPTPIPVIGRFVYLTRRRTRLFVYIHGASNTLIVDAHSWNRNGCRGGGQDCTTGRLWWGQRAAPVRSRLPSAC